MNTSDQIKSFFFLLLLGTSLSVSIITRIRLRDNGKTYSGTVYSPRLYRGCSAYVCTLVCVIALWRLRGTGKWNPCSLLDYYRYIFQGFHMIPIVYIISNRESKLAATLFDSISTKTKTPLEYSEQSNSYGINKRLIPFFC